MTATDELQATAHPSIPRRVQEPEWTLEEHRWLLAAAPAWLAAAALYGWGALILFAEPPAVLPRLPGLLGGIDLVAGGIVLTLFPPGIRFLLEDRRQRALDEQFPDFLSDLAANRRAGFTLAESVDLAGGGDYGPLTEEVGRLAAQLSWNVPFEEALQRFADRVDTPLITRATTLILEAERSGGHITDVLAAVATDARQIRRLERERHLAMRTYTLVMYVTFLVFLAVVAVLQVQMLPQLLEASGAAASDVFGSGEVGLVDHRRFFYTSALVQALGSGTMAGIMGRGRVGPGLIHAATMALITVFAFSFLLL
jgi:flagellar protein FlaJ